MAQANGEDVDLSIETQYLIEKTPKGRNPMKAWSKVEDEMLKGIVEAWDDDRGHQNLQWRSIAENMPGRSGKQCRERWCYHLRPNIKKGSWTEAEDRLIDRLQKKIGNKWSTIAESLPGRTDNDVKNRWHTCRKKQATKRAAATQVSKPRKVSEKKSTKAPVIDHIDKTPKRSVSATPHTKREFTMSIDKFDLNSVAASTSTAEKQVRFTPFDHHSRGSFMLRSWTENYLSTQMPPLHPNANTIHAEDIFSPSYFPRLMTAPTATATPYTPAIPLSVVSSCFSGPFITNTPFSNEGSRRCIYARNSMSSKSEGNKTKSIRMTPIGVTHTGVTSMGYTSTGMTSRDDVYLGLGVVVDDGVPGRLVNDRASFLHEGRRNGMGMTPLPYKKNDANNESMAESGSSSMHAV
ncbi:hypothetical protein ACHAW5_000249 [Stephanodiscus triporus]|uniref:Uncharacterized protein n=1 Tax=Stephanodiscus triporus TaxID=2934178 RepID=A0ABD3NES6_9STRA